MALSKLAVVLVHDVGEEDVRRFAAQFQRGRNQVVRGGLRDDATGGRRTRERNLAMRLLVASGKPASRP